MSSFKQLNKADITTVPYAANKHWDFFYTGSPSNGITFYRGTKSTFSTAGSTTNGQYDSLTYDFINHMFYQSYSGSLLDTGSLMFNVNTYESASQQRPTSLYFIYNNNPQLIKNFPSSSGEQISVISISPKIFGSKILPNSFHISASSVFIVDDGYGNLFDVDQARDDYILLDYASSSYFTDPTPDQGIIFVGNIFYAQGLAVITNQNPDYIDLLDPSSPPFTPVQLSFQNEHIIYENEIRCIVRESDFNLSYNPTLVTGSYENGVLRDFATGSAFQPYVTTIGLYNDNNDLLMVAKLGKPIALSSDTDMTFIVRYDT
jgi:hypothetical protein